MLKSEYRVVRRKRDFQFDVPFMKADKAAKNPSLYNYIKKQYQAKSTVLNRCDHRAPEIWHSWYPDNLRYFAGRGDGWEYQVAAIKDWEHVDNHSEEALQNWAWMGGCTRLMNRFDIVGYLGAGTFGSILLLREKNEDKDQRKLWSAKIQSYKPACDVNSEMEPYQDAQGQQVFCLHEALVMHLCHGCPRIPTVDSIYLHNSFATTIMQLAGVTVDEKWLDSTPKSIQTYRFTKRRSQTNIAKVAAGASLFYRKTTRLSEMQACKVVSHLLEAVMYLGDMNICHEDMSHRNYLVEPNLDSLLIDFGDSAVNVEDSKDFQRNKGHYLPAFESFLRRETVLAIREWAPHALIGVIGQGKAQHSYRFKFDARDELVWKLGGIMFKLLHGYCPWEDPVWRGDSLNSMYNLTSNMVRNAHDASIVLESIEERRNRIVNEPIQIREDLSQDCHDVLMAIFDPDPGKRPKLHELARFPWFQGQWIDSGADFTRPHFFIPAQPTDSELHAEAKFEDRKAWDQVTEIGRLLAYALRHHEKSMADKVNEIKLRRAEEQRVKDDRAPLTQNEQNEEDRRLVNEMNLWLKKNASIMSSLTSQAYDHDDQAKTLRDRLKALIKADRQIRAMVRDRGAEISDPEEETDEEEEEGGQGSLKGGYDYPEYDSDESDESDEDGGSNYSGDSDSVQSGSVQSFEDDEEWASDDLQSMDEDTPTTYHWYGRRQGGGGPDPEKPRVKTSGGVSLGIAGGVETIGGADNTRNQQSSKKKKTEKMPKSGTGKKSTAKHGKGSAHTSHNHSKRNYNQGQMSSKALMRSLARIRKNVRRSIASSQSSATKSKLQSKKSNTSLKSAKSNKSNKSNKSTKSTKSTKRKKEDDDGGDGGDDGTQTSKRRRRGGYEFATAVEPTPIWRRKPFPSEDEVAVAKVADPSWYQIWKYRNVDGSLEAARELQRRARFILGKIDEEQEKAEDVTQMMQKVRLNKTEADYLLEELAQKAELVTDDLQKLRVNKTDAEHALEELAAKAEKLIAALGKINLDKTDDEHELEELRDKAEKIINMFRRVKLS